jgi:p-aminobenzoyl-glutamate transporter AbgT
MAGLGISSTETWHGRSWLLTNLLGESVSRTLGLIIYLVSTVGFIAAGLGVMGWLVPNDWWRTLALVSAVISLVGLIFYWHSLVALFNKIGALGVNLAVLIGILLLNWPNKADF